MKSILKILLLLSFTAQAQLGKEAWHWQFGQGCSLNFGLANINAGQPLAGDVLINTIEGSASISDPNTGKLLFYTDGTAAYDRNGDTMPNGYGMIGGYGTSTQAALIVPKPGSTNLYYLISSDCGGYCLTPNLGVHYSVVDMNLNGGLGDVVSGSKNMLLTPPPTTEKLTAIRHANCKDYWIITHTFNSNTFNAYLVTSNGIDTIPVVSNVGISQINTSTHFWETIGYLKASPNGKKLASAVYTMNLLELFDFNNTTGMVGNPLTIAHNLPNFYPYGVSFSPDNSKLYVSSDYNDSASYFTKSYIDEYDVSSGNATTIAASKVRIASGLLLSGALQLGPDKKIYSPHPSDFFNVGVGFLSVINNPNNIGTACNYQEYGTTIFSRSYGPSYGLPNFIESNTENVYQSTTTQLCAFPSYTLNATAGNANYLWYSGDTTQSISVNSFGNYWVSSIDSINCTEIDTFHIVTAKTPTIHILRDTFACGNTPVPISINATYTNTSSYTWNNGFTSPVQTITDTGFHWIDFTFADFCISRDSFSVHLYPYPLPLNLGDDTTFCLGKKELNAYTLNCTYYWNTGQTTPSIVATHAGNYWVQVNNKGCKTYDSLTIYPEYSVFDFILPNIVTPNNDNINDYIDFGKYQFTSLQLEVYNRWGYKVFESNNPDCIWKPTEEDGTYYLVASYRIDCGNETQTKTIKSFITLLK